MALADAFDGFLIDLDGVVYVGNTLVPGADDAIGRLRSRGKSVLFLTNDPRSSRDDYAAKLRGLGIDANPSEILTSGAATAQWVAREEGGAGRSGYVIGSPALEREMESAGLRLVTGDAGRAADVVVVGGHDRFDYEELRIAAQALRRGAAFYATGRDATFPMPDGPWPATGAILAAVETAAGRRAHVVGKPEPEMFAVAREIVGQTARLAVVGDRLDSDILGGRRAGLATVLVLTGSTTEAEAEAASPAPDFVIADLTGLV